MSFNLEQAIQTWKRSLRSNPAFEDGDIAELEAHLRDEIEQLKAKGLTEESAFRQAIEEIGETEPIADELYKTRTTKPNATPPWKEKSWVPVLLPNYLKVAVRNLSRNKGYTFINLSGLAIALACCMLIGFWLQNQLTYDGFHANEDQIHRLVRSTSAMTAAPIGPALQKDYPEIRKQTRILDLQNAVFHLDGEDRFEQSLFFADPGFLDIFSFELTQGNPQTALDRPDGVIISQSLANKIFGTTDNVVGKSLMVDEDNDTYAFTITGIMKDVPENSHLQFDALGSFNLIEQVTSRVDNWDTNWLYTYLLVDETAETEKLNSILPGFFERHTGSERTTWSFQPLPEVYLNSSHFTHDIASMGNILYVYIFASVSLLILLIACVNFVNLTTARSLRRAKEVGMRKSLGAGRRQLIQQFLGETTFLTALSLVFAGLIVWFTLPFFVQITGTQFDINAEEIRLLSFVGFIFLLVVGGVAGSYPAFVLSSFKPVNTLRNQVQHKSGGLWLRKSLIVFQFAISIGLIAGMFFIHSQLNYLKNKNLGFTKEQVVVFPFGDSADLGTRSELVKQELLKHPGIQKAAASGNVPGQSVSDYFYRLEGMPENFDDMPILDTYFIDMELAEVLDLEFVEGRSFNTDLASDSSSFIVNQAAAELLSSTSETEIESVTGKDLHFYTPGRTGWEEYKNGEIIGVVKDFHYLSLHDQIGPLVLQVLPGAYDYVFAKIGTGDISGALNHAATQWNAFVPDKPFEYSFLDDRFDVLYRSEQQMAEIFLYFSFLAIFISSLGLFGLTAYATERRTKEIGIRKVLGASVQSILLLLSKDTLRLVLIGFIIAVPLIFIVTQNWLQNFAYHIEINAWVFLLAGLTGLLIAMLSVSGQAIKAALVNPVDSLRSE